METKQDKINRVLKDDVHIMPYNSEWPKMFEREKAHLLNCLPKGLIRRIEHFGSTSIPNLAAKPVIDMLVEVTSLEKTKQEEAEERFANKKITGLPEMRNDSLPRPFH